MYTTDALMAITNNTANNGGGQFVKMRFYDILHPPPEDTRTEEEVVAQVMRALKGGGPDESI